MRREGPAEVLGDKAGWPLHAGYIETGIQSLGNRAVDHVKALVGMVLIQPHLEIPRLWGVLTVRHVPFDVKDAVWRSAGNRGEDAAPICPSRATLLTCTSTPLSP